MKHIFLLGYMGSGKSILGSQLASRLNYRFSDTDQLIELNEKATVSELFESRGEAHFRALETEVLKELRNKEAQVVSCGGGLPCFQDNMDIIKEISKSFYLYLPATELAQRLFDIKEGRPLIAGFKEKEQLLNYVKGHLTQREKYYYQANFICDASLSEYEIIDDIIDKLSLH